MEGCKMQQENAWLHYGAMRGDIDIVKRLLPNATDQQLNGPTLQTPLIHAVVGNHIEIIKMLLEHPKTNVDAPDKKGQTALHWAASLGGNLKTVEMLIDAGGDVNAVSENGMSAILYSASFGHADILRLLVSKGGDINLSESDKDLALHLACQKGHLDAVRAIVELAPEQITTPNSRGLTALHHGVRRDRPDIVEAMLKARPDAIDVYTSEPQHGYTPLLLSIIDKHPKVSRLLLKYGADPTVVRPGPDESPLIHACAQGNSEMVGMLLSNPKTEVNQADGDGDTPLHTLWVRRVDTEKAQEIALELISHGAALNYFNNQGRTPIDVAPSGLDRELERAAEWQKTHTGPTPLVMQATTSEASQALRDACKEGDAMKVKDLLPNVTDEQLNEFGTGEQLSPLQIAAAGGNAEVVSVLLANGRCKIDCQSTSRNATALHFAIAGGNTDCAKKLINAGADLNGVRDVYGLTPLHVACQSGSVEIVKYLLAQNVIDVNACDGDDETPLHRAATNDHPEIIKLLLEDERVRVDMLDKSHFTPLHRACYRSSVSSIKMLVSTEKGRTVLNTPKPDRFTPIHVAAVNKCAQGCQALIDAGADLAVQTNRGQTPLYLAVKNKAFTVAEVLLPKCTPEIINIPSASGKTVLHAAMKRVTGQEEALQQLWAALARASGADVPAPPPQSDGAHIRELAERLVQRGATVDLPSNNDRTPLQLCPDSEFADHIKDLAERYEEQQEKRQAGELEPVPTTTPTTAKGPIEEDDDMCVICYVNPANCVFIPCTHMMLCTKCANRVDSCPVCRNAINQRIKPLGPSTLNTANTPKVHNNSSCSLTRQLSYEPEGGIDKSIGSSSTPEPTTTTTTASSTLAQRRIGGSSAMQVARGAFARLGLSALAGLARGGSSSSQRN
eukprot:TRINITY_DN48489_c0_g2_i1.p1 TRINITY_DN48489_c0_g2~~TRINITY_DN48489_c0_g2_i1.p1  ORF type:complete len:910 (+),score=59.93 TRINITY_DN48489_c0_g2_i1:27-2732(+)